MTANLFLERTFDDPWTRDDVYDAARGAAWCFDLHRVRWHGSFLRNDGGAMVCHFSAADLDSGRLALRDGVDLSRFWSGTVHEAPKTATPNVIVERSFASPVELEAISALEAAKSWCLETHRVTWIRTFFSLDRKRMLCFYSAPDAEAVRLSQSEAGMPFERVWAGLRIPPGEA